MAKRQFVFLADLNDIVAMGLVASIGDAGYVVSLKPVDTLTKKVETIVKAQPVTIGKVEHPKPVVQRRFGGRNFKHSTGLTIRDGIFRILTENGNTVEKKKIFGLSSEGWKKTSINASLYQLRTEGKIEILGDLVARK